MRLAVTSSPDTARVPAWAYRLVHVRVSGVDAHYAAATLVPRGGYELDPAVVLLRRARRTWQLLEIGTALDGICEEVPAGVVNDLYPRSCTVGGAA